VKGKGKAKEKLRAAYLSKRRKKKSWARRKMIMEWSLALILPRSS